MVDADSAVVRAVKAGNTEAFRILVDRHKGRLYAVIRRLIGDPDVAEELAQESFVRAFTGMGGFREESRFGTWLTQIGIHAVRDHLRRTKNVRERRILSLDAIREAGRDDLEPSDRRPMADPLDQLGEREEKDLMRRALSQLPGNYRELIILKHFEGWPYEELAAVSGDSVGTLKVRAHRARRMLKEALLSLGWQPREGAATEKADDAGRLKEFGHEQLD